MGKETRLFKSEEKMGRTDLADFLRKMADKIDQGEVVLRAGANEITLQLPQNLILEVQVEDEDKAAKGIQHSLELELKWYDQDNAGPLELG